MAIIEPRYNLWPFVYDCQNLVTMVYIRLVDCLSEFVPWNIVRISIYNAIRNRDIIIDQLFESTQAVNTQPLVEFIATIRRGRTTKSDAGHPSKIVITKHFKKRSHVRNTFGIVDKCRIDNGCIDNIANAEMGIILRIYFV